ncbi:MAG: hypothetical protein HY748_11795 [Elusimicrobia bacterium]|nr:hypothetical protein [Elusimicrobiota bacterium]
MARRPNQTFREEVFNVTLAELLSAYGLEASPETIWREGRPDVLVNMGGIKVVLEGRFSNLDDLLKTTRERVNEGLADIGMAVVYPPDLQDARTLEQIRDKFKRVKFSGALCNIGHGSKTESFENAGIADLVQLINSTLSLMVKDATIKEAVSCTESSLKRIVHRASTTGLFFRSDVLVHRLRRTLGISDADQGSKTSNDRED